MVPRRYLILTALAASMLATGCCCQQLSGRYCRPGCQPSACCCCPLCVASRHSMRVCCQPACAPQACEPQCAPPDFQPPACLPSACLPIENPCPPAADSSTAANCPASTTDCPDPCCKPHHCSWLRAWFAGQRNGVPSRQHPDYYSPPAKFHPIPTRPAFEALSSYPPLLPADPGMNNPLRASTDRTIR